MEETVTVFDWNLVWAIPLGIIIGAGIMWFWLKRKNKPDILANGILTKIHKAPKQPKKHKKDEIPDSDWPNASFADTGADLPKFTSDSEMKSRLATVTPSNHENHLG
jgi:hypothetical protein